MKFTIVFKNGNHEVVTRSVSNSYDKHEFIYTTLTSHNIDHDTAANCAGFCELASAGVIYNETDFNVYIEED